MSDPLVQVVGVRCACGLESARDRLSRLGKSTHPIVVPRSMVRDEWECDHCGEQAHFQLAADLEAERREEAIDDQYQAARE